MRDDFSDEVKRILAARVGNLCSNPNCRAPTSGPQVDPTKSLNVGVAAHITAAAQGGPRYNPVLSPEQRKHSDNGLWLCQTCAKLVDNDELRFPEGELRKWKEGAEGEALLRVGKTSTSSVPTRSSLSPTEMELLIAARDLGEVYVLSADQVGQWIRAGSQNFIEAESPRLAATYLDAFKSLAQQEFLNHQGGSLYLFSRKAWDFMHELDGVIKDLPATVTPFSKQLSQLAESKAIARVRPIIPAAHECDDFRIERSDPDLVEVQKLSSQERVQIPIRRIVDVLPAITPDPATLLLEGRLQWLTIKWRWKFLETKPDASTPFGFSKASSLNDARAIEVGSYCERRGGQIGWVLLSKLATRLSEGWTIVYDDDGKYFRIADRLEELVLITKPF